jgi:hypothetical protein
LTWWERHSTLCDRWASADELSVRRRRYPLSSAHHSTL